MYRRLPSGPVLTAPPPQVVTKTEERAAEPGVAFAPSAGQPVVFASPAQDGLGSFRAFALLAESVRSHPSTPLKEARAISTLVRCLWACSVVVLVVGLVCS